MKLEEIEDEWERDCNLSSDRITEDTLRTPKLHSKYIRILNVHKLELIRKENSYNLLRKNKFKYFRGELSKEELSFLNWYPYGGIKPLKSEMDEILNGDTELNDIKTVIEYYKITVYLLEQILSQIKARDWQIKNIISWEQFKAGN